MIEGRDVDDWDAKLLSECVQLGATLVSDFGVLARDTDDPSCQLTVVALREVDVGLGHTPHRSKIRLELWCYNVVEVTFVRVSGYTDLRLSRN